MRAQVEKKMAQKEKEKKEESLRLLAQKAREESAGIRRLDGRKHARSVHPLASCVTVVDLFICNDPHEK